MKALEGYIVLDF